jgi:putative nucleotidyltransferase with HDIG domain
MSNLKIRRKHITAEIENLDDLPTLPQVAQHVIALSQDPKTSFRDLKKVIISDPPLAAKVMMMANSAYFHRRNSAKTLEEAIFTIGLKNLIAICTSVGVLGAFDRWSKGHMDRPQLWRHSVATAFLAKSLELRKALDRPKGPDIFVAGLLHDIGWIVFDKIVPELVSEAINARNDIGSWSLDMESDIFGIDHVEAGTRFLEQWKIPQPVIEIVANHHSPESSEKYAAHAGVVRIASLLVQFKFPLILPFDTFPVAVPNRLESPHSPLVMDEMEEKYADYINQANTIAELMVGWF